MKKSIVFILLIAVSLIKAQDKLFFRDGKKLNCAIVSIDESSVNYADSTKKEQMSSVLKKDLLMAEKNGSVIIFGSQPDNSFKTYSPKTVTKTEIKYADSKMLEKREKEKTFSNNIIGIQIPDLIFGRLTMTYERLFNDKQMGIVIPASLSYDPRILFFRNNDTALTRQNPVRTNVGFITGLDLNYYFARKSYSKFFVGPRFRYGTDVYMLNITGYSVQLQNGFLACSSNGKLASTFAFGVGYVRVLSVKGIDPKQSYPWMSVTIRIGFRA